MKKRFTPVKKVYIIHIAFSFIDYFLIKVKIHIALFAVGYLTVKAYTAFEITSVCSLDPEL